MAEEYEVWDESGYTSKIYLLPGTPPRACKSFNKDRIKTLFPVEKEVYERFAKSEHPSSILKYYGVHDTIPAGLVLEFVAKGNLYHYLWEQQEFELPKPDNETLYRWAFQAAEGLEFAHSLGICNSDIHCINFLLDEDLNLKVGDWAGASINGSRSGSSYRLRHRLVDAEGRDVPRLTGITVQTEIFALGTALYYMVTGHDPWPELREPEDSDLIKKRIQKKDFPETSSLPVLGDVISKCWNVSFVSMTEVKLATEAEQSLKIVNGSVERSFSSNQSTK